MDSGFTIEKRGTLAGERRRSVKLMRAVITGLRARLDEELRAQHITSTQLQFLGELKKRPGMSGAQMARACGVTPQSAQAMLERAVEHGWVVRGKDAENSRLVTAQLTVAGYKLLLHADAVFSEVETVVWDGVAMAELRAMNKVLARALEKL